jgi:SM-20-related protein
MAIAAARINPVELSDTVLDLDRLAATPVAREPFMYLVVKDFIRPERLESVLRDFPAISGPSNYRPEQLSFGPAFGALLEELTGAATRRAFARAFEIDLDGCTPSIGIRGFSEATDGNIHTDHRTKVVTVLVYFNRTWPHDGGQLRMMRSQRDIDDYAAEVVPLAGTMLAFRRSDDSFHGHKPHVGERKMLQMSYVQQSALSRLEKRLSALTKPVRRLLNMS